MEIVTKVEPYAPLNNYPVEYKRVLYTREDLESIPLEPSKRVIRLYDDSPCEKAVEWDSRLAQGFKRYRQLHADLSAKYASIKISEHGYRISFVGSDNLDVSSAVVKLTRSNKFNTHIDVFIPYAKPKHWSRTWPGLWNHVKTVARRYL